MAETITRDQAIAEIRRVVRRCRGRLPEKARVEVARLYKAGKPALAERLDEAGRKRCGYNFNKIIEAGPWDGKRYTYTCPDCGVVGDYRAPTFNVEG